ACSTAIGPSSLLGEMRDVPLLCGHSVRRTEAGRDGVAAVVVAPVGSPPHTGGQRIACDAVLLGVGTGPGIELLDAVGCEAIYRPERGGHVPLLDSAQRTSVPGIYAAGDCAGIWPAKALEPDIARTEGRRAAADVAAALGLTTTAVAEAAKPEALRHDPDA